MATESQIFSKLPPPNPILILEEIPLAATESVVAMTVAVVTTTNWVAANFPQKIIDMWTSPNENQLVL